MDSTSISPSAPASTPTGDWLTVLNDLRRSVSNLVLYVLECVPMAHTWPPANPAALPLSDTLPAMTPPTAAAAAAQVPSTSLEEAIQSLAAQEPWTASWLPTDSALPPAAAATAVPLPPKKSVPRKKKTTPVSQQQQQQQQQQQSQPPTPSMPIIDPYANHYAVTHPV